MHQPCEDETYERLLNQCQQTNLIALDKMLGAVASSEKSYKEAADFGVSLSNRIVQCVKEVGALR